jgi:hypothetical protein
MTTTSSHVCSINRCPQNAVTREDGRIGSWFVTIHYCHEHAREMREATPVGPLGIDPAKLEVKPAGTDQPSSTTGRFPGIA